jgi:hypothetical protein
MRLKKVFACYMDLTTDSILLYSIWYTVGDGKFEEFSYQVAVILLVSIIVPLYSSAFSIAISRPLVILKAAHWKNLTLNPNKPMLVISRIVVILFPPLVPALIIISNENAKERRSALKDSDKAIVEQSDLDVCEHLTEYIDEARKALLVFKRNELSLELVVQLTVHLTMLLLSYTQFPVESGLQSFFKAESDSTSPSWVLQKSGINEKVENVKEDYGLWLLAFSLVWSFKTCAKTCIKIKLETKRILPLKPKLLLTFRYHLIFLQRIASIIVCFSASIGLIGIMDHYHAESISLGWKIWCKINGTADHQFLYWNSSIHDQVQSVNVADIFRSEYSNCSEPLDAKLPKPPSPILYTDISFGTLFALFGTFYVVYGLLLTLLKQLINEDFRSASNGKRFQHILEAINIPDPFGDWDTDPNLDVQGHQEKWNTVLFEMRIMVLAQLISNMIFLIPFWITGKRK